VPNIASAKKRTRQAEKNRQNNVSLRSKVRTYIKTAANQIEAGDVEKAQQAFQRAVPIIDSMVNKGIIHKNKAARHKSRLSAKIKALALTAK
jgi:small subunit ribosomal protein S20